LKLDQRPRSNTAQAQAILQVKLPHLRYEVVLGV
jgi:hypothetical protein